MRGIGCDGVRDQLRGPHDGGAALRRVRRGVRLPDGDAQCGGGGSSSDGGSSGGGGTGLWVTVGVATVVLAVAVVATLVVLSGAESDTTRPELLVLVGF